MLEIINELISIEKNRIPAVLCIVTATTGSTPRKAGSKMIVFQDGTCRGTIGGGSIEFQVIREAQSLISSGGNIQVRNFKLLEDLNMQCGGSMEIYFEPIACQPKLYIFGGGHIGKALAGYATGLGFHPVVIDPRQGIFDDWNLFAGELMSGDYLDMAASLDFNDNTYIVIVTHQHESDEKLLHYCALKEFAYLGMIGSKRKVGEISKRAIETGKLTAEILSGIDMPIGIPFAAETPAEIAISIIAKMIDVKNTRKKS
ncbi:MAG: xanthine dehydrogenase accessory factor [Bacteroidetes bacterium]|nr:MAG: xanthine dehydrogenase accessory factor [Bacteroidota bacterium]